MTDTGIPACGPGGRLSHQDRSAVAAGARSEVRRYVTLPGQATGYKIGMRKIMELRHKAEAALGPKFDIKGFHDLLIASVSQPLPILERRVDDWIVAAR